MTDKTAPESQLRLEWVYGYRGHQCRNNLHYTASGEVVYFVAGVGVVYNVAEGKQRFYLGHSDDIISLALHPDKNLVATGQIGKEPFVCVWDSTSLETVSILQGGHERGITALAFSHEGNPARVGYARLALSPDHSYVFNRKWPGDIKHLVSVGLDDHHTLNIWDWRRGKVIASTRGHSDRIFDIQFNPHSASELVTCGVKHIKFWVLHGNSLSGKRGLFGKKGELQSILCAVYTSSDIVYTGTLSGDLYKWKGHTLQSTIKGAHKGPIFALMSSSDGYATGSRDGTVRLWDKEFTPITQLDLASSDAGYKGLAVRSVCWAGEKVLAGTKDSEIFELSVQDRDNPRLLVGGHAEGELWALAVHPSQGIFATGSDDKTVRIWNMTERSPVISCGTPHPVRSLAFSPDGGQLAAGMQDGSFTVYSAEDLSKIAHFKKRKEVLHEMKYSPDGHYLAVGSNDNFVDVYSVGGADGYKHVGHCSGSSSFITHLDWSADSKYIQTNSGASERLYYQVPGCKRITAKEEIQSIHWATWTGVLGSEVNGIWPKYTQVNDINATDTSFDNHTIVTGDDFGLVKLFRFPCIKKGAKFRKYVGHSAHVTNVRFTFNKHHVISVGGADHAIFQWRFITPEDEPEEGAGSGAELGQSGSMVTMMSGGVESDSEGSDSDASDVGSVDSDLEQEQEKTYQRDVYREDLQLLKRKIREKEREAERESKRVRGIKASSASAAGGRKGSAPEDSLTLEFVHGYRGYDCRNNLFYTKDGDIVYHIAALGVVYTSSTHNQRFYSAHTDDILCLALHPAHDYVATGQIGRDPAVHVWDAATMETLSILKGEHSRGVCAVGFSGDGKMLASVGLDDDHCIVVWDWKRGERLATTRGHKDKIFMISWNPHVADQLVTVGVKHIKFWNRAGGCKRITAKEEIQSIHWATWTGVLGSEVNGIWPKYTQVNDINATDTSFDNHTIVTGDDFGLVKLFRFPCIKKGAKFRKYVGHSAHVTNVRFTFNKHHVISVGGADHAIFQWRFITPEDEPEEGAGSGAELGQSGSMVTMMSGGVESDSEGSDSDASDVGSVDSDLEQEQEKTYQRDVYREDLQLLKRKIREKEREAERESKRVRGIKASSASAAGGRKGSAPEDSLTLEFVHGYRGYDCRNNLFYTKDGDIVYHIAALGVVYTSSTHNQRFYSAHTDDILCLALHPAHDYVATGQIGRDPAVHVWDAATMETLSILKGEHSRGVCAVGFSGDGKMLASVGLDDDHCIVVWDWKRGERLATTRGHKDKIFMISWNPHVADQLVTVGVKHIKFWNRAGGGFTSKRGVFGKAGKLTTMLCVAFGGSGEGQCFTGGATGLVYHWRGSTLSKTVEAHKGPIFAMQKVEKGFVSGGKDGVVCLWDESFSSCLKTYQLHSSAIEEGRGRLFADLPPIRALSLGQGKILVGTKYSEIVEIEKSGPIHLLIQGHMEGEAWGLATHPSQPHCVTVSDDGTVRVWDLHAHSMPRLLSLGKPARCVGYSVDGGAIAIGFKDGSFTVMESESFKEMATVHHRKEEISDVKFSPNGKYLAVASHDNFVDIYNVVGQKRVGICKGASSYITHVDWDIRGKLLQVNTGDREVLYYEAPRGKQQLIGRDDAEDILWHTWTSVLGSSVQGVWPPYTDVTDVNTSCVSHDGHVIATGDDFGFVKLFKYPSYGKHAKCKQYVGHSAHVTNVRFSHDDRKLVSVGGADTSVMIWSHNAGSCEPAVSDETSQSGDPVMTSSGFSSEDSDTDSEEEGGYDSDVEREKSMDYVSMIYAAPIRDAAAAPQDVVKPHKQETKEEKGGASGRGKVSRALQSSLNVVTSEDSTQINDLSLDYIFGYRGFDTRQNVHLTPDGSVLYHAAGAGVVYNPLTKTQSFYLEHNDDIMSLCLCRNPKLSQVVATGQIGKVAPIHVWDYHTKQTLSILQGAHGVGVCSVDFSCNGKLLLAVGLDSQHSITVWRWTEATKVAQVSGDDRRIFVAQFRPDSNTKFVSCGVKHVRFWNLAGTQLIRRRGHIPGTSGATLQTMLSLAFAPDDITFTGSISGDVYVWKGHTLSRVVSQAHSGPVFAMYTCLEDGLVLTAGKERKSLDAGDGGVKLWGVDMSRSRSFSLGQHTSTVRAVCRSKGKILVGTQNSEVLEIDEKNGKIQVLVQGHGEGELWGLAVHPSSHFFITASDDKLLRLWDISNKTLVHQKQLSCSARSTAISPDGRLVAVGQTNGEFILFSYSDLSSPLAQKRDRSKTIQAVRFSPDGKLLAVGSDDACVDVYCTSDPSQNGLPRCGYCRGIPSAVTGLDWSHDSRHLQVSTGTYEKLVFEVSSGRRITEPAAIAKIVWASWTSVLGDEIIGIWPKNADKADVNTAHLSHSGTAVATGDDFGCVKLFDHFPVTEKFASCKKYFGHSAHVTNVRFTHDDQYLLSAGGDDSCVFLWKCQ